MKLTITSAYLIRLTLKHFDADKQNKTISYYVLNQQAAPSL